MKLGLLTFMYFRLTIYSLQVNFLDNTFDMWAASEKHLLYHPHEIFLLSFSPNSKQPFQGIKKEL